MSASIRPRIGYLAPGHQTRSTGSYGVLAAGGLIAALGASSCCILPLVLFSVGVSGAWIGNLTALAPYQPFFIVVAVALLGAAFVRIYRKPTTACADDRSCGTPASDRLTKVGLWTAAALVVAALAFPYTARLFLEL